MSSLMDLSPEMLEQILLTVDSVEDVISLGSSSLTFARILAQERIWRIVLSKTEMVEDGIVMKNRMRTISAFLTSLPDSGPLFSLLHLTICQRFPGTNLCPTSCTCKEETITVSFPGESELHKVSGLGMELSKAQVQGAIKMTPSPTSDDMLRIPRHTLPTDAVGYFVAVKIPAVPGAL